MSIWRSVAVPSFVTIASLIVALTSAHAASADVDGRKLYFEALGAGDPTVVFESGLGTNSRTWSKVVRDVAKFTRVFIYDREGLGRSSGVTDKDRRITAADVASRLRALLNKAGVAPPYIIVGHSQGGLYAQYFARTYKNCIAGVVLVEAASPDAPDELGTRAQLKPGSAAYLEDRGTDESNRQIRAAGSFPDVPLRVIAATDHGSFFRRWEPTLMRLQEQLATLSPRGKLIVAKGSGHDVHRERTRLVIDAILDVVAEARSMPRASVGTCY